MITNIVLASNSGIRLEILKKNGFQVEQIPSSVDEEEVKNSIDLDTDLDFLETLSLNEFERENSRDPQSLPDCVTITVIIQQGFKEITLDFGEGCQVGNKNISGIMTLTYQPNIDEQELLITKDYKKQKLF